MIRIANSVENSAKTIKELGKTSTHIGEIVAVIDDIADQTNLLALNAAIEAARKIHWMLCQQWMSGIRRLRRV